MIGDAVGRFLREHGFERARLLVAASGGVDSTALLLALAELNTDLVAAHVNHHLRGADSDADEAFVRDLCARLGIPLHVADGTLDPNTVRHRGVEAAAREVRYARLAEIRAASGATYVATAHQRNDQAETVLMRLLTGSGMAGLRGIHPIREDGFIRPLLEVRREEIEAFLRERGVEPRLDRSNESRRFLRNRIRPLIRELGAVDNLAAVAAQAREQWPTLERAIDEAERASTEIREDETAFLRWPEDGWLRAALLHRHIRRLDPHARDFDVGRLASEVERVRRASVTRNLELVRRGAGLVLRRLPQPTPEFEIEIFPNTDVYIPELERTVHLRQPAAGPRQRFQLPPDASGAFTIRNRRRGDRFHPLGLAAPKKLKDFLIDRKIAAEIRDRLPLLIWNDEIVWIAGVEISERFKVTDPAGVLYEVWLEGSGASDERNHPRLQR